MKRSVLLAVSFLFAASLAFAQAGSIGVFSDCAASDCSFQDTGPSCCITVNMIHVHTAGATGARFALQPPPGWSYIGEIWNVTLVSGSALGGATLSYAGCLSPTIPLGCVTFWGTPEPPCTYFGIVPDPGASSGRIEAWDCGTPPAVMYPTGGQGIVNSDGTCDCNVPVSNTSWGNIKGLYR